MYSVGPGATPKKNLMPVPEMNYSQALAQPPKLVIPKNPESKQSKQQTPEDGKGTYQLVSYKRKPRQDKKTKIYCFWKDKDGTELAL